MISLQTVNIDHITPALEILGAKFDTQAARRMILAIGLQESGFATMVQYGNGPARSYYQFEKNGGVKGVLTHRASAPYATALCKIRAVGCTPAEVWKAMETDGILGAGMARLLLFTDPKPMPTNAADGWNYYKRNWRPGKPHPDKWAACWKAASDYLGLTP